MDIPDEYKILDVRTSKDFKDKTISNYLRKDVLAAFQKSLLNGKIEDSCNWAVELVCSGQIDKVYDKFLIYINKYINTNNLDLLKFFYSRYNSYIIFKKIVNNDLVKLRNYQNIRNHIAELCCLISLSSKNKAIGLVRITEDHFNTEFIKSKFRADNDKYIEKYCRAGDTEESKIILNEFIYNLDIKNYDNCLYWISWIFEWEKVNIKKNKEYKCGYRKINNVDEKTLTDVIWFIWEIILNYRKCEYIMYLFKMFKFNYKASSKSRKMPLLLFAIKIHLDFNSKDYNMGKNIYENNINVIVQVIGNINKIYKEHKKFEENDSKKFYEKIHESNLIGHNKIMEDAKNDTNRKKNNEICEKSVKKMDTMGKLDSLLLRNMSNR